MPGRTYTLHAPDGDKEIDATRIGSNFLGFKGDDKVKFGYRYGVDYFPLRGHLVETFSEKKHFWTKRDFATGKVHQGFLPTNLEINIQELESLKQENARLWAEKSAYQEDLMASTANQKLEDLKRELKQLFEAAYPAFMALDKKALEEKKKRDEQTGEAK